MERSTHDIQVLIVGAGPTGLSLALWLTRLGVAVRIIDQTAAPGTTSRALGVQARTLEFFRQVGIADRVVDGGVMVTYVNFLLRGAGVVRLPFQRIGEGLSPFPFLLIFPQDAQERLLIAELETLGVTIERRTTLLRFDQSADGVQTVLQRPDGSEHPCVAAYLAGCDGARSTVRETLSIGFPGGTYSHRFYVADVEATGPATAGELYVDLDVADFVLVFPLKGAGRVRLVGTVRDAGKESDERELTIDDISHAAIQRLRLTIQQVNWFSTYRVHHRVAHRFRVGRAFLLGDAAHIHSPVGAQGMNTGIGDAVNLAWKLAAVVNGRAADGLLDSYEAERIPFARRLVSTADRAFTLVTGRGAFAARMRSAIVTLVAPPLVRLASVRRLMFRTVSQIGIHYRDSPLSAGAAGGVHGGDRLPWIPISPNEDNFTPLASLAWQVHVYGAPRAGVTEACAELGVPLHCFAWTAAMREAGLTRGAIYLVRPDGYLALVDPNGDAEALRRYLAARAIAVGRSGASGR